jgi:hypothetical protein
MANKNIITTSAKVSAVELTYIAPSSVAAPYYSIPVATTYCFLSKATPWEDDNNPPQPGADVKYIKQVQKNMFVAKLISINDISPVIQRIDWTSGTVYEHYQDDIDMIELDANGNLVHVFYAKNKYDQVFKCLWNNNNQPSTVEPYFEPGSYNTNNLFLSPSVANGGDGYKWKYIYTIDTGLKVKFMDKKWIPVSVGANTPSPLINTAGAGSIDVINITNGGSGYDQANAVISVTVLGDGYGVEATANVIGGVINDIIVTNPGSNYTYSNVIISSDLGSGAVAEAPASPVGGHGFDPISELGCSHVMFTAEFNGSEGGIIPTDIDFHQLGLVSNPSSLSSQTIAANLGINSTLPANGAIYKTTTDLIVAPGFGTYVPDEVIFQGPDDNIDNATFIATSLSFDTATNVLRLINTTGTLTKNAPVRNIPRTNRTLLDYTTPDFSALSGYVTYIENRSSVQRSSDGIEQIRIVLGY